MKLCPPRLHALALLLTGPVLAEVPNVIPLQGRVSVNGENFNGEGQFKFVIYEAPNSSFSPASLTALVAPSGAISDVTIQDGGSGYTSSVALTIRPGLGNNGSGATAVATVQNGIITDVTVTTPGSGYSQTGLSRPSVRINEPTVETVWTNFNTGIDDIIEPTSAELLPVSNGLYVVGLGDQTPIGQFNLPMQTALPEVLDTPVDGNLYVRVWFSDGINGFEPLSPDIRLDSVPFARMAETAKSAESAEVAEVAEVSRSLMGSGQVNGLSVSGPGPIPTTNGSFTPAPGAELPFTTDPQMYFNPGYGAFRVGAISQPVNTGYFSTAIGRDTIASGNDSIALGEGHLVSGSGATSIGSENIVLGSSASAIGSDNEVSGSRAIAIGSGLRAPSSNEIAIGSYNENIQGSAIQWIATDRLFSIGNGNSPSNRSDAFVMLKNGRTTFNGSSTLNGNSVTNGNSLINGMLEVRDSISFSTPKPKKLTLSASTFLPQDPALPFGRSANGLLFLKAVNPFNGQGSFQRELRLPEGARVTKLTIRVRDAQPGISINASARLLTNVGNSLFPDVMATAEVATTNGDNSTTLFVGNDSTITNAVINPDQSYLILLSIDQNGQDTSDATLISVYSVAVEYEVSRL